MLPSPRRASTLPSTAVASFSGSNQSAYSASQRNHASATTLVHQEDPVEGEMRPHWHNSYPSWPRRLEPCLQVVFTALCFIGIGRPDLTEKWQAVHAVDDCGFREHTQRITGNLSAINIVVSTQSVPIVTSALRSLQASLLLTSAVAFVTSVPPRTDVLDYTIRGPYICLIASFGVILGGIIVGCTVLFVLNMLTREWTRDVRSLSSSVVARYSCNGSRF